MSQTGQYPQYDSTVTGLPPVVLSNSGDVSAQASPFDQPMQFDQNTQFDQTIIQYDPASTDAAAQSNAAAPDAVVTKGTLPAGSDATQEQPAQTPSHEGGGLFPVIGDIIGGAISHVIEHPMDVVTSIGTGIVLTVVAGAAIAAAAPIIATAPAWVPLAAGLTLVAAGAGITGWAASQHAPKWWSDITTVFDASHHTAQEVAQAHNGLRGLGGDAVDFAAGFAGGGAGFKLAGSALGGIFKAGIADESRLLLADAKSKIIEGTYHTIDTNTPRITSGLSTESAPLSKMTAKTTTLAEQGNTIEGVAAQATVRTGEQVMESVRATAQANDDSLLATAIKTLKDPREVEEVGKQLIPSPMISPMQLIYAANDIRRTPFLRVPDSAYHAWLDVAKDYEQKALPQLQEMMSNPDFAKTLSPEKARRLAKLTSGLKDGKTSDTLIGEWDAMDLAKADPKAIAWIGRPGEVESFLEQYSLDHPNYRNEIATALQNNLIPENRAQQWAKALESMPETEVSTANDFIIPPDTENIVAAVSKQAKNSMLPPELYAVTNLKNPEAIKAFVQDWSQLHDPKQIYPATIRKMLDNDLMQPGTKEGWLQAIQILESK